MIKKTLSLLLAVMLLAGIVPAGAVQAFAAEVSDTATGDGEYPLLPLGETVTVEMVENGSEEATYQVTSPQTRAYAFYTEGQCDTIGTFYDENFDQLEYNDDSDDRNFRVTHLLEAGKTYYLTVKLYRYEYDAEGKLSFTLCSEEIPFADSLTIDQGESFAAYVNDPVTFTATLSPENALAETVTWSSSDDSVAAVDDDGYTTFLKPGEVVITASVPSGRSDSIAVTVNDLSPLSLNSPATTVFYGTNSYTFFRFTPEEDGVYVFSSANADDTIYCELGEVLDGSNSELTDFHDGSSFDFRYRLTAGKTYYVKTGYEYGESSEPYQVQVVKAPAATGITIDNGSTLSMTRNKRVRLSVSYTPEDAEEESITWQSSDESVVSVDNTGEARMMKEGTAIITATSENGLTATCTITVTDFQNIAAGDSMEVTIEQSSDDVYFRFIPDETATYTFTTTGSLDTIGTLYDSSMSQLVSNDDSEGRNFLIRRELQQGETYYINARLYGSDTGSFILKLLKNAPATGLMLNTAQVTDYPGTGVTLTASFLPEGAFSEELHWMSSDDSVASVTDDGEVSLNKLGTAVITVSSESGLTATCAVTVKDYETLVLDETKSFEMNTNEKVFCQFVPEETRDYTFTFGGNGEADFNISDSNGNSLYSSGFTSYYGDTVSDRLFFTAGEPYYFKTITHDGYSGAFELLVSAVPYAQSVSIECDKTTGYVGTTLSCSYYFSPGDSMTESVEWSSSDESVAVVDSSGTVTLLAPGTADITATTKSGLTDTVTVTAVAIDAELIQSGDTKTVTITEQNAKKLFKFVPEQSGEYVIYSGSFTGSDSSADLSGCVYNEQMNDQICRSSGSRIEMIADLTEGETYYLEFGFYYEGTGSYQITLERRGEAQEMRFSSDTITGYPKTQAVLNLEFLPKYSLSQPVTYRSEDESVASVNEEGRITFNAIGTTTVTAESENGLTAVCTVVVKNYELISAGEIKAAEINTAGSTVIFQIVPDEDGCYSFYSLGEEDTYGYLLDADMQELTRNDDGGENNNFLIQYELNGGETYYLRTRYYSSTAVGSFNVKAEKIPYAQSVSIRQGSAIDAYVGESVNLDIVSVPENSFMGSCTWTSSDEDVASVDNVGGVYFNTAGTVTITATTQRGLTVSCDITVKEQEVLTTQESKTVNITYENGAALFRFTPDKDDYYAFYADTDAELNCYLYEENGDYFKKKENVSDPFLFKEFLQQGSTYLLKVKLINGSTGSVSVSVENAPYVTAMQILSEPERTTYVSGYTNDYLDLTGLRINLVWSDGEELVWEDGDEHYVRHSMLNFNVKQSTVTFNCDKAQASFELNIIPNPVESIEVLQPQPSVTEYTNGYWNTRRNEVTGDIEDFYYYESDEIVSDAVIQVNYTDGTSETVSPKDMLNGYRVNADCNQYRTPWTVGENAVTVSYLGFETTLYVTVEESPVESIEILGDAPTLIENADGYWVNRYNEYTDEYERFFNYYISVSNVPVRIQYKDGTAKDAEIGDTVDGEYISYDGAQERTHWTLGSDNKLTVRYMGAEAEMNVTIVENPVERIEVINSPELSCIEETDGYWSTTYNPETGKYDLKYFDYYIPDTDGICVRVFYKDGTTDVAQVYEELNGYRVSVSDNQEEQPWTMGGDNVIYVTYLGCKAAIPVSIVPSPVESISVVQNTAVQLFENSDGYLSDDGYYRYTNFDVQDAVIQINYTNGTSKTAHVGDLLDGYYIEYEDNQRETPWTLGTNYLTVTYMSRSAQMPITVLPNPVASLTVTQAPTRVYVYGDPTYGGIEGFYPGDLTGLAFTVTFKDGTTKSYTDKDIDNNTYSNRIDGHSFSISVESDQTVGSNTVTFNYLGAETTYNVNVRESTVEKIEVTRLPDNPSYSQYYQPDWRGMQVTFTDKNGAAQTVTLSDSNIIYGFNFRLGYYTAFEYDGELCVINTIYREQKDIYVLNYGQCSCEIEGLTYRTDKTVTAVEVEDFNYTGENMLVKITNEDGTTESFRLTNTFYLPPVASPNGIVRALTDKGVLTVNIIDPEHADDLNFVLYVFGCRVKMKSDEPVYLKGDVNGDGKVTVDDVTELQRFLAEFSVDSAAQVMRCGDVNGDGKLDVKDVTCIQRYLAQIENNYNIGSAIR